MTDTHVIDVPMDTLLIEFTTKLGLCPPRFSMDGDEAVVVVKLDDGQTKRFVSNAWYRFLEDKRYSASLDAIKWIEQAKNSELIDFNYPEKREKLILHNQLLQERVNRADMDHLYPVLGHKLLGELIDENRKLKAEVERRRTLQIQGD